MKNKIPLSEENPAWKKYHVKVTCPRDSGGCGWEGQLHELMADRDETNDMLWCPQCGCSWWIFDWNMIS